MPFHRGWASNLPETCFSLEPVSERHQPCRPSARLPRRHVVWCTIEYWQSNQEGPKQPGPHELWKCREGVWYWSPGSRTGEESGWGLPAAGRRPLLIGVLLPRPRRLKRYRIQINSWWVALGGVWGRFDAGSLVVWASLLIRSAPGAI
jgi:hypothetical protein